MMNVVGSTNYARTGLLKLLLWNWTSLVGIPIFVFKLYIMAIKLGRFYYQQTKNGNLIGEYANKGMNYVGTESAILSSARSATPFEGEFEAVWLEDTTAKLAKLIIAYDAKTGLYKLKWKTTDGTIYNGEGMLCGEILVGAYE